MKLRRFRKAPDRERATTRADGWIWHGWRRLVPGDWGQGLDPIFGQPITWVDRAQNIDYVYGVLAYELSQGVDSLVGELIATFEDR